MAAVAASRRGRRRPRPRAVRAASGSPPPAEEQPGGRVVDRAEQRREARVAAPIHRRPCRSSRAGTRRVETGATKRSKPRERGSATRERRARRRRRRARAPGRVMRRAPSASGTRAPPPRARQHDVRVGERRDRPRDPCHPRPAARGERQPLDCAVEQLVAPRVRRGAPAASRSRAAATRSATGAGASPGAPRELVRPRPRHGDDEVEAVEQRPRDLVPVAGEPLRRAGALGAPGRRARRTDRGSSSRRAGSVPGRAPVPRPARC